MSGKSGGSNALSANNISDQPIDLVQKSYTSISRGNENVKATLVHFGGSGTPIIGSNTVPNVTCKPVSAPVAVSHIPRGAAVVANMTPRSQNLPSIVRTPSLCLGTSNTASRTNFTGQQFPMASNNWISRGTNSIPVSNKVSITQVPGRAAITTTKAPQATMMPITTYTTATIKSGGSLRSPTATVRIGPTNSEGVRHASKGVHIAHAGQQKYIGTGGVTTSVRAVSSTASGGATTLYSPTATLVTSLASSGTTITAHPANRSQNPPNTLRITSAITSSTAFSQERIYHVNQGSYLYTYTLLRLL